MSYHHRALTYPTFAKALPIAVCLAFAVSAWSHADISVRVTVTNNAPSGGTYLTPVWVGFHDGSFDSYDGGTASAPELERLAEDGNASDLANTFAAGGTLAGSGSQDGAERRQGMLGAGPIAPGQTLTQTFDINDDGSNTYFSYASMVLPSNDYYVANGNPFAHSLADLIQNGDTVSFDVFGVNDAGTEINDFATSAGNGLFSSLGLPGGQSGPNQGADQNGVNQNVLFPFIGFLNRPSDADTNPDFAKLNFSDGSQYPRGLLTFNISAVPEPGSAAILGLGAIIALVRRRR